MAQAAEPRHDLRSYGIPAWNPSQQNDDENATGEERDTGIESDEEESEEGSDLDTSDLQASDGDESDSSDEDGESELNEEALKGLDKEQRRLVEQRAHRLISKKQSEYAREMNRVNRELADLRQRFDQTTQSPAETGDDAGDFDDLDPDSVLTGKDLQDREKRKQAEKKLRDKGYQSAINDYFGLEKQEYGSIDGAEELERFLTEELAEDKALGGLKTTAARILYASNKRMKAEADAAYKRGLKAGQQKAGKSKLNDVPPSRGTSGGRGTGLQNEASGMEAMLRSMRPNSKARTRTVSRG